MKKIPCSGPGCGDRRIHWSKPDTPRGVMMIEVEDDYKGKGYCSITCAIYDGAMTLRKPNNEKESERLCT